MTDRKKQVGRLSKIGMMEELEDEASRLVGQNGLTAGRNQDPTCLKAISQDDDELSLMSASSSPPSPISPAESFISYSGSSRTSHSTSPRLISPLISPLVSPCESGVLEAASTGQLPASEQPDVRTVMLRRRAANRQKHSGFAPGTLASLDLAWIEDEETCCDGEQSLRQEELQQRCHSSADLRSTQTSSLEEEVGNPEGPSVPPWASPGRSSTFTTGEWDSEEEDRAFSRHGGGGGGSAVNERRPHRPPRERKWKLSSGRERAGTDDEKRENSPAISRAITALHREKETRKSCHNTSELGAFWRSSPFPLPRPSSASDADILNMPRLTDELDDGSVTAPVSRTNTSGGINGNSRGDPIPRLGYSGSERLIHLRESSPLSSPERVVDTSPAESPTSSGSNSEVDESPKTCRGYSTQQKQKRKTERQMSLDDMSRSGDDLGYDSARDDRPGDTMSEKSKKRASILKKRSDDMKKAFEEKYKRIREGGKCSELDELSTSPQKQAAGGESPQKSPQREDPQSAWDPSRHERSKNDVWKLLHFDIRKKKLPLIKERSASTSALSNSGGAPFGPDSDMLQSDDSGGYVAESTANADIKTDGQTMPQQGAADPPLHLLSRVNASPRARRKNSREVRREKDEKDREKELREKESNSNKDQAGLLQRRSYSVSSFIRRGAAKKSAGGKGEDLSSSDADLPIDANYRAKAIQGPDEKRDKAMRQFEASMSSSAEGLMIDSLVDALKEGSRSNHSSDSTPTTTTTPSNISPSSSTSSKKTKTPLSDETSTTTNTAAKGLDLRQVVPTLHGRRRGKSETKGKSPSKPKTSWLPLRSRRRNSNSNQPAVYCSDDMPVVTQKGVPGVRHRRNSHHQQHHRHHPQSYDGKSALRLDRCGLGHIDPYKLGRFVGLQALYLGYNTLRSIPNTLGRLTRLRVLRLEHNMLEKLPPEIGHLVLLETLNVSYNSLRALPPEIGHLERLRVLNIENNQIKRLPEEMGRLFQLFQFSYENNPLEYPRREIFERGVQEVLSFLRVSTRQRDTREFYDDPSAKSYSFTTDDIPGFFDMVAPRISKKGILTSKAKALEITPPAPTPGPPSNDQSSAEQVLVDGSTDNRGEAERTAAQPRFAAVRPRRQSEGGAAPSHRQQKHRDLRLILLVTPPLPPPVISPDVVRIDSPSSKSSHDQHSGTDHTAAPDSADATKVEEDAEHRSVASSISAAEMRTVTAFDPTMLSLSADRIPVRTLSLSSATSPLSLSLSGRYQRQTSARRASIGRKYSNASEFALSTSPGRAPASPTFNRREHRRTSSRGTGASLLGMGGEHHADRSDRENDLREAEREAKRVIDRILATFTTSIHPDHPVSIFKKTIQTPLPGLP